MIEETRKEEAADSKAKPSDELSAGENVEKLNKVEVPSPVKEEPKLFAGKYKSVEELEKAYKEAEKTMHQKAREAKDTDLSTLLEDTPEVKPEEPSYPPYNPYPDYQQEIAKDRVERRKFKLDMAIEKARTKHNDFQGYESEVIDVIKTSPSLIYGFKAGDTSTIDLAYDIVKARHVDEEIAKAQERKQKEIENINATTPNSVDDKHVSEPPPPPPKSLVDKLKGADDSKFEDLSMLDEAFKAWEEKGALKFRR